MTTTNRPTVARRREELDARLAGYLDQLDGHLRNGLTDAASAYAQAAQAVAAALAVLPTEEPRGGLWVDSTPPARTYLHMSAEDGQR